MAKKESNCLFQAQMARIMFITGMTTQCQLAKFLNITQASISDAAKRRHIPAGWLVTLVQKICLSPDWVLGGTPPVFLHRYNGLQLRDVPLADLEEEVRRRRAGIQ